MEKEKVTFHGSFVTAGLPFSTWWTSHLVAKHFYFNLAMNKLIIVVKVSHCGEPLYPYIHTLCIYNAYI